MVVPPILSCKSPAYKLRLKRTLDQNTVLPMKDNVIKFLKSKDYVFLDELGKGACGRTVKLKDEVIDEVFVCKKYEPFDDALKDELFSKFIQEIKLLYLLNHRNVVRVFNYYIYPEQTTGYILMEYIEGSDIEKYVSENPHHINEIFTQTINGFTHLEKCQILHRDIRPLNIMVSHEGVVKVIDFGFGKMAVSDLDFDKSISLNWWCEPPQDFKDETYDFRTEIYFVGKLFRKVCTENMIETFKYGDLSLKMCEPNPIDRYQSFQEISRAISETMFVEDEFTDDELYSYRSFSKTLDDSIVKIADDCKYYEDISLIQKKIEDCYRSCMLEEKVPSNNLIARCFLNGGYYFSKQVQFPVSQLKWFLELLRSSSKDKKKIIIDNVFTKLDSIKRYSDNPDINFDDDIPF